MPRRVGQARGGEALLYSPDALTLPSPDYGRGKDRAVGQGLAALFLLFWPRLSSVNEQHFRPRQTGMCLKAFDERSMRRRHHHPKTVVVPFVVRVVPVAVGATRVPVIIVERAAAQHTRVVFGQPRRMIPAGGIIRRFSFYASRRAICLSLRSFLKRAGIVLR